MLASLALSLVCAVACGAAEPATTNRSRSPVPRMVALRDETSAVRPSPTRATSLEMTSPVPRINRPVVSPSPTATSAATRPAVVTPPATAAGPMATPRPVNARGEVVYFTPQPHVEAPKDITHVHPPKITTPCEPFFGEYASYQRWLFDDFVDWSADGSVILFSRGPLLYGASADGTRAWPVADATNGANGTGFAGTMIPFDLSPDGTQVVFTTCQFPRRVADRDPGHAAWDFDLVIANVDGTRARRLTLSENFESHPSWSPDGESVAYWSTEMAQEQFSSWPKWQQRTLHVRQADGTGRPTTLKRVDPVESEWQAPQWSPDGRRLAVAFGLPSGGVAIEVIDRDGGNAVRLSEAAASAPTWSPDGERVAFAKVEALGIALTAIALYTMAADGTDAQRLAPIWAWYAGREVSPSRAWIPTVAWSPDGTRILLVVHPVRYRSPAYEGMAWGANGEVLVVSVAGSERGQVRPIAPSYVGRYGLQAAAWSPDGSRLAVVANHRAVSVEGGGSSPSVFTAAADGSDRQWVTDLKNGQLQPWNAPRPYDRDHLRACRNMWTVPDAANNPGLVGDCAALHGLWTSWSDPEYANWLTPGPLGEWEGVGVGGSPPRVRELRLADGGLRGSDVRALRWLTELRRLEVSEFRLGFIPHELGQLEHLEVLRLVGIGASHRISPELGQLANLQVLDLSRNELTGPIPSELEQLRKLTHLDLSQNRLTGTIPAELSQLAGLREVRLAGNQLTGCVPDELPVVDREELGLPDCAVAA